MLTAVSWTHPMHGEVTEVLCASHEPPALAALCELGHRVHVAGGSDGPVIAATSANAGITSGNSSASQVQL